ncbi:MULTISPECIES: hypothetical protein [unclassified Streptomyces]|uniref:hypothetical protein n=1 Tax=unclassified Streptomyces TaxID=2593676 RepID=UPI002E144442|nr:MULTISPECIES: hypothetical protein [unclassified Streptomyces]WSR23764.1 hypothetical protein OG573_34975 [Streptomyces sp. NBC_01205]
MHATSAAQRIRRRVRLILEFLDWLDAHHLDLAGLDQNRLDTWLRNLTGQLPWLFPGVVPGRPLSRKAFNERLARQGIHTRPARTAALIALATELPAPVLADLLDIHIHTALKWARHAQRDWSTYLTARATDLTAATQPAQP